MVDAHCSSSRRAETIISSRSPIKTIYTDPRVRFVDIDLLKPVETIVEQIKELCQGVTHTFFTTYVHNDFPKLHKKNGPLFRNFIEAVDLACPKLQRVVLQTGGKVNTDPGKSKMPGETPTLLTTRS